MLATVDPGLLDRVAFPLGGQGKQATRDEATAAGLAVARRKESQEACFLAGSDYRAFLERQGLPAMQGRSSTSAGPRSVGTTVSGASRPASGAGSGSAPRSPHTRSARTQPRTRSSSARAVRSRSARSRPRARLYLPLDRAEAKLRYRSDPIPARVELTEKGFRLQLDEPASGVAPGQVAVLYDDDAVIGAGIIQASKG